MSDLVVKAMLTMDGSGLKGASKEAATDLRQVEVAADGVSDAGKRMGEQTASAGAAFSRYSKQGVDASVGLTRNIKSAEESYGAFLQTLAGQSAINAALGGQDKLGGAYKLNAFQVQELSYGVRHLFEQIAAGINPAQIAASETLHMSAAFGTAEGAGALLNTVLSSTWLYLGLGAAAFALIAYQSYEYEKSQRAIGASLTTNLPQVALTREQYSDLASDIANAAQVSQSAGRDMAKSFADQGITPAAWTNLASAARDYADATDGDVAKASDDLAKKLQKPTQALMELNANLGVVTQAGINYVRTLEDEGRLDEARAAAAALLSKGFSTLGSNADALSKNYDQVKRSASGMWDELMKVSAASQQYGNSKSEIDFNLGSPDFNADADGQAKSGDATRAANKARQEAADLFAKMVPLQTQINQLLATEAGIKRDVTTGDLTNQQGKLALAAVISQLLPLQKQLNDLQELGATADVGAAVKLKSYYDQYGGYAKQTSDLGAAHHFLRTELDSGTLTAKQHQQAQVSLNNVELQASLAAKQHRDQLASLDQAGKAWQERIKSLLQGSAEVTAQWKIQTEGATGLAAAILISTLAYQQVLDKQAQERAALPYVTAALRAQGDERKRLLDLAQQARDNTADQQAAQHFVETVNDIRSAMASLSDNAGTSALQDALGLQVKDLGDWRDKSLANLDSTKAGYDEFVRYVGEVYDDKLRQIYERDLARRTDWASGIQRANLQASRDQDDWAKTSETSFNTLTSGIENDFEDVGASGKKVLDDLLKDVEATVAKILYQRYIAGAVGTVVNAGLDALGSVLGVGSSVGSVPLGNQIPSINAGVHHGGGIAGVVTPATRSVPVNIFAGAPRYHGGGIAGLKPGEVPAILNKGEPVLTTVQAQGINAELSRPIVINLPAPANDASRSGGVVINNFKVTGVPQGQKAQASAQQNNDGSIDVLVDIVDARLADKHVRGASALGNTMEMVNGLSRGRQ